MGAPLISVERFAEIIADAFGPIFAAAASTPAKPLRKPIPYRDMPEGTKDIFRGIAEKVINRRGEWDRADL